MSSEKVPITKIDGVNYARKMLPVEGGSIQVEGITVRALRKALERADQDAIVIYVYEDGEKALIGIIAGAGLSDDFVSLFGPEAVPAIKKEYES